jgi:hypothetical protein
MHRHPEILGRISGNQREEHELGENLVLDFVPEALGQSVEGG